MANLPACMMPDGGDPCEAFSALYSRAEAAEQQFAAATEQCARTAAAIARSVTDREVRWLADDIVAAIRDPESAVQKVTTKIALSKGCDRGTFTVCWGQYEKGLPCKCEDEARAELGVPLRALLSSSQEEGKP
jgi:hypothetical protein